ncbi:MAG: hypothetical protein BroJett001_28270 [Chloroflexota bacterium]|jgi:hypothetical protein|nr:MAG: hypothetical protein BroJett001_28270 [Chloroflexota bacterium]
MLGFKLQIARSNDHAVPVSELGSAWGNTLARPVVKSVSTAPCGSSRLAVPALFALTAIMCHLNPSIRHNLCHSVDPCCACRIPRARFTPTYGGDPHRRISAAWAHRHPITLAQMMSGIVHELP